MQRFMSSLRVHMRAGSSAQRALQAMHLGSAQSVKGLHSASNRPQAADSHTNRIYKPFSGRFLYAGHMQQHLPGPNYHHHKQQHPYHQRLCFRTYATNSTSNDSTLHYEQQQQQQQQQWQAADATPGSSSSTSQSKRGYNGADQELEGVLAAYQIKGDGGAAAEEGPGQPKASHLPTVWTSTDARLAAAWDASLTSEQRTILHERLAWQQRLQLGSSLALTDAQGRPLQSEPIIPLYLRQALTPSVEEVAAAAAASAQGSAVGAEQEHTEEGHPHDEGEEEEVKEEEAKEEEEEEDGDEDFILLEETDEEGNGVLRPLTAYEKKHTRVVEDPSSKYGLVLVYDSDYDSEEDEREEEEEEKEEEDGRKQ